MEATPYLETFVMAAAAVDGSPLLRLLAVLEEMMEAAGRHAERLGVGVPDLHAKNLTWVLARLHVQIEALPASAAAVRLATWPAGRQRIFALRDFRLQDGAGNELLRATSAWALMNLETRRPARLDPHLPVFASHPPRALADDFPPLPPPYEGAPRRSYRAEAGDIDLNDHVNNTVYLGWALRSAPAGAGSWQPLALEAAFLGEARLGDEVACLTEIGRPAALDAGRTAAPDAGRTAAPDAGRTAALGAGRREGEAVLLQSLRDVASGRELTRLRSRWRTQGTGKTKRRMREE
jgi:medium-chain acyl-[acyl-carrier-protein] hydrolase